jgi:hypothetical protein
MKAKMKLDKAQLQRFLLNHGEKVGAVIFGLWFVLLVWGAFGVQNYDKTPEDLSRDARQAKTNVENSKLDERKENIVARPHFRDQILAAALETVDPALYPMGPLNPPLFERKVRRGEPGYYPAEELLAHFDQGGVLYRAERASERRGQQWVTLLALVPYERQAAEYSRVFQNAQFKSAAQDVPNYVAFEVQRALVVAGEDEPQWQKVDVPAMIGATLSRWDNGNVKDPTPAEVVLPALCEPLPSVSGRTFEPYEVVHPRIVAWMENRPEDKPAAGGPPRPQPPPRPGPAAGPRQPAFGGFGQQPGSAAPEPQPEQLDASTAAPARLVHRLFRFMDFGVRSDETYRYRIRLVLANPNLNIAPQYLAAPKLGAGDVRYTDWSAPSEPVRIPSDYYFLAGEVKPRSGLNEPAATLKIRRWMPGNIGLELTALVDKLNLGQLLDFTQRPGVAPGGQQHEVDFTSGGLLVDVTGGDGLAPNDRLKAPGEMLVMDANGRLSIRSQFSDNVAFNSAGGVAPAPRGPTPREERRPTTTPQRADDPFGGFFDTPEE